MSKPPPKGKFWQTFAALTILPTINGSQKAVLGCLLDHANPTNGLCYPTEARIAAETNLSIRAVERAVAGLLRTPYLSRKRRYQSSNTYDINFDALLKVWSDYKARGAAYRVTDQKVADQAVEGGGLIPSRLADKHKNRTAKEKQESRMASPQGGDGVTALLRLPAGEVKNLGGLLARFERAFTNDPEGIQDLDEWYDWLYQVASGERGNPNVERAIRLFQDVFDFQESRDAA